MGQRERGGGEKEREKEKKRGRKRKRERGEESVEKGENGKREGGMERRT